MRHHDSVSFLSVAVVFGLMALFGMRIGENYITQKPDVHALSGVVEYMVNNFPNRSVAKGSGVFISPTKVLTAAHVLQFAHDDERWKLRVRLQDGDLYNVKSFEKSKKYDLGLITLDRPYRGNVNYPKFDCGPTKQGQILTTVGSPLTLEYIDVEIRAIGGDRMELYRLSQNELQDGPDVPLPEHKTAESKEKPKPKINPKKYHMVPPNGLPKPNPEEAKPKKPQEPNSRGGVMFQGPSLPGQSGAPVYDEKQNIKGVVIQTLIDDSRGFRSYAGLGMMVDSPYICEFVQGRE